MLRSFYCIPAATEQIIFVLDANLNCRICIFLRRCDSLDVLEREI